MLPTIISPMHFEQRIKIDKHKGIEFWLESSQATSIKARKSDYLLHTKSSSATETGSVIDDISSIESIRKEEDNTSDLGSEYFNTDLDSDEEHVKSTTENKPRKFVSAMTYRKLCDRLGILPIRKILSKFGKQVISLKDMSLTQKDIKAICTALLFDAKTTSLDLCGTQLNIRSCRHVIELMESNTRYLELDISNNHLGSDGLKIISEFVRKDRLLIQLNLAGNKICDRDSALVAIILKENTTLRCLILSNNEFGDSCGRTLGGAIAKNKTLKKLDLSWNHIRRFSAIEIARGLERNKGLEIVDLSWNGFSFEGCVAISDALQKNQTIKDLNLASNRIHPPALLELTKGLCKNKTLKYLKLGHNPITAVFTTVLIGEIRNSPEMSLERLNLEGIVVAKEFENILKEIQDTRRLAVTFETSLSLTKESQEKMLSEATMPSLYNVDPIRMLYLLKEKNRAQDFFRKIKKDKNDNITKDELYQLFKSSGIPVTEIVVCRIMDFMDKSGDGCINLAEFLEGDKQMRKISRKHARQAKTALKEDGYNKYSRSFRKTYVDPTTLRLRVNEAPHLPQIPAMSQAGSRKPSLIEPNTNSRPNSFRHPLQKKILSLR